MTRMACSHCTAYDKTPASSPAGFIEVAPLHPVDRKALGVTHLGICSACVAINRKAHVVPLAQVYEPQGSLF